MRLMVLFGLISMAALPQVAPFGSSGVSMGHLHVITPDPEAHKKIWVDVLGGKLVRIGPLEFASFPGVFVGFRKGDSNGGTEGSVVNHLGFLTRELGATKQKLVAAGVSIVSENPETRQFFAMFPGEVKVEFTEDTKLDAPIKHHHVHFATDQIEEMRAWYAKVFGAVPGMRARFRAADLPGVNLSWNPADKPTIATKGRVLDHIGFEIKELEAFCAKLEAGGIKLETPVTHRPELGIKTAFLNDPWGTRIELTEGLVKF